MDDHDKGVAHDLDTLGRRRVQLGAAGLATTTSLTAWGCGGGDDAPADTTSQSGSTSPGGSSASGTCAVSAEETEGPFPADGSNTIAGTVANALALTGIVRSDLRASFGAMSGTADGVPVTLKLTVVNPNNGRADLAGYAVYVWRCDRDGAYSLYGATNQNYLRGVQETDASGTATFITICPGCYSGRMPHIHIEVYRSARARPGPRRCAARTKAGRRRSPARAAWTACRRRCRPARRSASDCRRRWRCGTTASAC